MVAAQPGQVPQRLRLPLTVETLVQVVDLLVEPGNRAPHDQARGDVADRQRPHRQGRRAEFGEPALELLR